MWVTSVVEVVEIAALAIRHEGRMAGKKEGSPS